MQRRICLLLTSSGLSVSSLSLRRCFHGFYLRPPVLLHPMANLAVPGSCRQSCVFCSLGAISNTPTRTRPAAPCSDVPASWLAPGPPHAGGGGRPAVHGRGYRAGLRGTGVQTAGLHDRTRQVRVHRHLQHVRGGLPGAALGADRGGASRDSRNWGYPPSLVTRLCTNPHPTPSYSMGWGIPYTATRPPSLYDICSFKPNPRPSRVQLHPQDVPGARQHHVDGTGRRRRPR